VDFSFFMDDLGPVTYSGLEFLCLGQHSATPSLKS
jgi:hypothetical protein